MSSYLRTRSPQIIVLGTWTRPRGRDLKLEALTETVKLLAETVAKLVAKRRGTRPGVPRPHPSRVIRRSRRTPAISGLRGELSMEVPEIRTATRDGTTYPIDTTKIGRRTAPAVPVNPRESLDAGTAPAARSKLAQS